jgi:hypothetical protein
LCHRFYFEYEEWSYGLDTWWSAKRSKELSAWYVARHPVTVTLTVAAALLYNGMDVAAAALLALLVGWLVAPYACRGALALVARVAVPPSTPLVRLLNRGAALRSTPPAKPPAKPWDADIVWQRMRVMYEDDRFVRRFSMLWAKGDGREYRPCYRVRSLRHVFGDVVTFRLPLT